MLFERSAVSLFERGKRAKQVEERERVRERESKRDEDDDDDGVKFHSAGPRERHSFFPRKKNITQQTRREKESLKRKEKKEKPRVPARSHRLFVVAF